MPSLSYVVSNIGIIYIELIIFSSIRFFVSLFRSRQVRVFFADDNDTKNRSMKIRRNRGPRKNYMEDSEDKPIQQSEYPVKEIS